MSEIGSPEWEQEEKERLARAKARFLELLQERGVARAEITYDGFGDSGQVDEEHLFDPAGQERSVRDRELSEALDELVCAVLPLGWENNHGGFGTVTVDVAARTLHVTHNDRFEDFETHDYDVEGP